MWLDVVGKMKVAECSLWNRFPGYVVAGACEVEELLALLHHLIDSVAVFLRLREAIAGSVDQLINDVVKPQ